VTIALVLSSTTSGSPLVIGTTDRPRAVPSNSASAMAQALKCSPTKGFYARTFVDRRSADLAFFARTGGRW